VVKSVIEDVTWRSQVQVKVNELTDDLERAGAVGFDPAYATNHTIAERCITRAHDLAKTPPKRFSLTPIHRWLSGSDVESAWAALHDAEAALCMILPSVTVAARLADLRAGVSTTLRGDGRGGIRRDAQDHRGPEPRIDRLRGPGANPRHQERDRLDLRRCPQRVLTSFVPQDRSGLLAYAFLFGAAPEILLRLLDNKVNAATAAARPRNDPLTTVSKQDQPADTAPASGEQNP